MSGRTGRRQTPTLRPPGNRRPSVRRLAAQTSGLLLGVALLGGCVTSGTDLRAAAVASVRDPATWLPLGAAAAVALSGRDHAWSESLARRQPLFGSDAADTSDDLRDLTTVAWLVTAVAAPVTPHRTRLRRLAVGAGAILAEGALTTALKEVVGRERPNGRNDRSFPSGHAAQAASRAALAMHNLDAFELPRWGRTAARVGLFGVAAGASLARVEAGKHHLVDVLAGYALGNFISGVAQRAFVQSPGTSVTFEPHPGGGALRLTLSL